MAKNKGGRPTIWSKDLMPKFEKLYRRGFTDAEVAEIIGVCKDTLHNWKKKYKEFFDSIMDWKIEYDERIERSLAERAEGYEHPETKFHYDKDAVWYDDKDRLCTGRWISVDTTKRYPPDTQAASLWLRNRKPKEWRDKVDLEHSGKDGKPLVVQISSKDAEVL